MAKNGNQPRHHDFTGQLGGGYLCSVCHTWLTPSTRNQECGAHLAFRPRVVPERPHDYVRNVDPTPVTFAGLREAVAA